MSKKTTEQFILDARKIHKEFYDYSCVNYINNKTKVKIICKKCGYAFEQQPRVHLSGSGCPYCCNKSKLTQETFVQRAKNIHNDKFDYSLFVYKGYHSKSKIKCNTCNNIFEQEPASHLNRIGCPYCAGKFITTQDFIKKSKSVHGDKYIYDLVDYNGCFHKVKIICSIHGVFEQTPSNHLNKSFPRGCPKCSESSLEKKLRMFLMKNNIEFTSQKKFDDLKDKSFLSYDFYIPSKNLLIECNGIQHYKFTSVFQKTEHDFHRQLHHDWLKREYAKKNNFELFVIKFSDDLESKKRELFTKIQ